MSKVDKRAKDNCVTFQQDCIFLYGLIIQKSISKQAGNETFVISKYLWQCFTLHYNPFASQEVASFHNPTLCHNPAHGTTSSVTKYCDYSISHISRQQGTSPFSSQHSNHLYIEHLPLEPALIESGVQSCPFWISYKAHPPSLCGYRS